MKTDTEIEEQENAGEQRLWWHIEPWLIFVFLLFLIAAIANWRAFH